MSMILFISLKLLIFICLTIGEKEGDDFKRLLLNDPDVAAARFANLESNQRIFLQELQNMNSTIRKLSNTILELQSKNDQLTSVVNENKELGTTYVQWGRKSCTGQNAETVYSGSAAGQHNVHPPYAGRYGGPANMLCLPTDPEISNQGIAGYSAVYGAEYHQAFSSSSDINQDVPCSVCRTLNTSASIMIPGRKSCYTGWNEEYYGYLAAGSHDHSASSYICMDIHPEYVPGGMKNEVDNRAIYLAGTACGTIECPPYENLKALYCVVCSK